MRNFERDLSPLRVCKDVQDDTVLQAINVEKCLPGLKCIDAAGISLARSLATCYLGPGTGPR